MVGHSWRHFDPLILLAALALAGYGALVIYSASLPRGAEGIVLSSAVQRHIIFALVGAVLMVAMTRIDYRLIDALGWLAYGFGIIVLIACCCRKRRVRLAALVDLGFTVVQHRRSAS